jgi:hypothetical protein
MRAKELFAHWKKLDNSELDNDPRPELVEILGTQNGCGEYAYFSGGTDEGFLCYGKLTSPGTDKMIFFHQTRIGDFKFTRRPDGERKCVYWDLDRQDPACSREIIL